MTSMQWWELGTNVAIHSRTVWIWSHPFSRFDFMSEPIRNRARWLRRELKPLYIPSIIVELVCEFMAHGRLPDATGWEVPIALVCYWAMIRFGGGDDDDDDRWKRRRKRLAEAIKEAGGKLVVVPEPQPTA